MVLDHLLGELRAQAARVRDGEHVQLGFLGGRLEQVRWEVLGRFVEPGDVDGAIKEQACHVLGLAHLEPVAHPGVVGDANVKHREVVGAALEEEAVKKRNPW